MRAAVYRSFGGPIAIEELPRPSAPSGGVVLEVKATGVCRSDWHGWKGHDSDIHDHGLPFVPGHELSGVVHEVGEGVTSFVAGDRVAVPFILSCGSCCECMRDRCTVCEQQEQPGFTRHGSFAEYVALPRAERNLCRLPAEVSFAEAAALGCRFTTAYRAIVQRGRLVAGETVAVFGCGGLGLSAIMIAVATGARVIAVDVNAAARAKAVSLGAVGSVDASLGAEATRKAVLTLSGEHQRGCDVTVDAAGFSASCEDAVWTARRGGRMVQVGLPIGDGPPPNVPMARVANREIEILGSHGLDAADMPAVLSLVAQGKLKVKSLIEREVGLAEGAKAIEAMDQGSPLGITVVTTFR
jgi:alcohol dehydrogenase